MKRFFSRFGILAVLCIPFSSFSQIDTDTAKLEIEPTPVQKLYWGNGMDAAIFSSAIMQKTGTSEKWTTLRFTYMVNFGFNLNYDFGKTVGIFTGIGIKNIGFIEKLKNLPTGHDSTIKRRVYTIGLPLGLKIGNLQKRNYVFLGGGADVPFNYREKGFVDRGDKKKFSEWFSDRTPLLMPYMFIGGCINPGVTFKVQYYPSNFLNEDFRDKDLPTLPNGAYQKPYAAYDKLNLVMFTIGFDIHYKKKHKETYDDGEEDADISSPPPAQM